MSFRDVFSEKKIIRAHNMVTIANQLHKHLFRAPGLYNVEYAFDRSMIAPHKCLVDAE